MFDFDHHSFAVEIWKKSMNWVGGNMKTIRGWVSSKATSLFAFVFWLLHGYWMGTKSLQPKCCLTDEFDSKAPRLQAGIRGYSKG